MATYSYTYVNPKTVSTDLVPFGRILTSKETINSEAAAHIPSNATVIKVEMYCEFNQKIALGSTKGDVNFYFTDDTDCINMIVKLGSWEGAVAKNGGWQPFSADITSCFYTSGDNVGKVSVSDANYLAYEGYSFVVRNWYLQNAKITWYYTIPDTCVVTLNANGGTVSPTTVQITQGNTYGTLPTPTRTGHKFNYWSLENGTRIYSSTVVNSSHTLVANWTVNTYTITATAGTGGTVSGGGTYNYGAEVTLIAEPSAGYKFKSWSDGDTNASRKVTVTGAASYVAEFEKTAPEIEEVALIYSGSKVSATNKVVAGEGFVVKVRLK